MHLENKRLNPKEGSIPTLFPSKKDIDAGSETWTHFTPSVPPMYQSLVKISGGSAESAVLELSSGLRPDLTDTRQLRKHYLMSAVDELFNVCSGFYAVSPFLAPQYDDLGRVGPHGGIVLSQAS